MALSGLSFEAEAGGPADSIYVGPYVGVNIVRDDWDLGSDADSGRDPSTGVTFGARVGTRFTSWLGAEIGVGLLPIAVPNDNLRTLRSEALSAMALNYSGDLLLMPFEGRWQPYLDIGAGMYHALGGDLGSDLDYHFHYGLGFMGWATPWMAIRADARHIVTDGSSGDASANNFEITAGVTFNIFGGDYEGTSDDYDGDGVKNDIDTCPRTVGLVKPEGCPDRDGDGIRDSIDVCPDTAGIRRVGGCPEPKPIVIQAPAPAPAPADKPAEKGDADADADDPNLAMMGSKPEATDVSASATIPQDASDSDGDGVADDDDLCPKKKGTVDAKGCPDADRDGVIDSKDKCPSRAGVANLQGCPPKLSGKVYEGRVKPLLFKSGSADLNKAAKKILRKVAWRLKKYSGTLLVVEGHTDVRGPEADNATLSRQRAEAVKKYLVGRGVDADRISTTGYGATRAVASNKSASGRSRNRRAEMIFAR